MVDFAEVCSDYAYLYTNELIMGKLTSENSETFIMRISPELKNKLNKLAKRSKYGGSASAAIRILIEAAYRE